MLIDLTRSERLEDQKKTIENALLLHPLFVNNGLDLWEGIGKLAGRIRGWAMERGSFIDQNICTLCLFQISEFLMHRR